MTRPLADDFRSDPGTSGNRRAGSAALRRVCLILAPCWALPSVVFCTAEFILAMEPQGNPALAGPFPSSPWFLVALGTLLLCMPLAVTPVVLGICGLIYLRGAPRTGLRWLVAWAGATATAIAVDVMTFLPMVSLFIAESRPPATAAASTGPDRPPWQLLVLSGGFLATALAMMVMVIAAARPPRPQCSNGSRPAGARRRLKAATIWVAAAAAAVVGVASAPAIRTWSRIPGPVPLRVLTDARSFRHAVAIAYDGRHVWIASDPGNGGGWVTELNASDGALIRTLSGARYGFHYPAAIAFDGTHIWVANDPQTGDGQTPKPGDGTVTELNASDGSWVRTLSGPGYGFDFPSAIVVSGGDVWVANGLGTSVTEVKASDGSVIRTLSGSRYGFDSPSAITVSGSHIWVVNAGSGDNASVTEFSAADGSWIRTLPWSRYSSNDPSGIAVVGGHIWVTTSSWDITSNESTVFELDATDGRLVKSLSSGCHGFYDPSAIIAVGDLVWFAGRTQTNDSVTALDASSGRWVRTLSGDSWFQVWWNGCTKDPPGSGYGFSNLTLIAAVGDRVWVIGDGTATILPSR